jgi:ubiquinone/menaquinone biosynthesis C-methylase UbiE
MASDFYSLPDLYDAILPVGKDIPFYLDFAKSQGEAVLELACGTGLLTVPIAATDLPTVGLDLSNTMLDAAKRRGATAGVSVEWLQGNMREFNLAHRFGFIFVARHSLQHLLSADDLLACFAAVKRHLSSSGIFVFDIFNPDVEILARRPDQRFPVMEVRTERYGTLRVESSHRYDAATQISYGTWYVSTEDQQDKWVLPITVRCIFPEELLLLLSKAGFKLIDRFGDATQAAFTSGSPKQICVCRPMS